jgi:hypothetical protein
VNGAGRRENLPLMTRDYPNFKNKAQNSAL